MFYLLFNENKSKRIAKGLLMIKLIECFKTWQGEGPDAGRSVLLLRFKNCNQNCYFCDTSVKMRISEEGTYTIPQLQSNLNKFRCGLLITGGEPTFTPHYNDTLTLLENLEYEVANVETNGHKLLKILETERFIKRPVKFIYSPKIFNGSSEYEAVTLTNTILDHPQVYIKIPYMKNGYVDNYCRWLSKEIEEREEGGICGQHEFDNKVWLMALGSTEINQKTNSADVMDACELYKFNFSGRLHIMYDFI